jgi:hypothetical protein
MEWIALYALARLVATAVAAALLVWGGEHGPELLLVLYGPLSTAVAVAWPRLRRNPAAWAIDSSIVLALVVYSDDWRSPFYLSG